MALTLVSLMAWISAIILMGVGTCEFPGLVKVPCLNPRPQICTHVYQPVCAYGPDRSSKTKSNSCTACQDLAVSHWTKGVCELDQPPAPLGSGLGE